MANMYYSLIMILFIFADEAGAGVAGAPNAGENLFIFERGSSAESMLKAIPVPLSKQNIRGLLLNLQCLQKPPNEETIVSSPKELNNNNT